MLAWPAGGWCAHTARTRDTHTHTLSLQVLKETTQDLPEKVAQTKAGVEQFDAQLRT